MQLTENIKFKLHREFVVRPKYLFPNNRENQFLISKTSQANTKASYGTHFYLGTEIEKISIADLHGLQMPSDAEYDQDLRSELHETEPQRYFLVPEKQRPAFLAVVAERAELKPRRLGTVRRYAVYRIERAP